MSTTTVGKWSIYKDWLYRNLPQYHSLLNIGATDSEIESLNSYFNQEVPDEVLSLYRCNNGAKHGDIMGAFLGFHFLSITDIIKLKNDETDLYKTPKRIIPNEEKANELLSQIKDIIYVGLSKIQNPPVEFTFSEYSYSYRTTKKGISSDANQSIMDEDAKKNFDSLKEEFCALEKDEYGWDEVKITATENRIIEVQRLEENPHEYCHSQPEGHIQKLAFHQMWLPLLHDNAGCYIGVDLAPGEDGIKGQIINFGSREDDKFVAATSLDGLLQIIIDAIKDGQLDKAIIEEEEGIYSYGLRPQSHLIDDLREITSTR